MCRSDGAEARGNQLAGIDDAARSAGLNMLAGQIVDFRTVEWDGTDRWRWAMRFLGRDASGMWLGAPATSVRIRPNGIPERIDRDVVRLLPSVGLWCAMWNHAADLDVYIDVCAKPTWDTSVCRVRDLQLDVLRYRDGTVKTLDEDEFEAARQRWRYTSDLVSEALTTARTVHRALLRATSPFDASPLGWLSMTSRLQRADLPGVEP